MKVVEAFRGAFPRIQFITTTHDPLCLRGLKDREVIVLRCDPEGRVFAVEDLPNISGLYVDQLLTSDYFGRGTTLDPELELLFEEYYGPLAEPRRDARQEQRLGELREVLAEQRELGTTERERLALTAVDLLLARRRKGSPLSSFSSSEATGEIAESIVQLWSEAGLD
jgi:hypothetical protein